MAKDNQEEKNQKKKGDAAGDGAQKKSKKKGDEAVPKAAVPSNYMPRLLKKYREEIAPALQQKFSYSSPMQVPRLQKIVLNMGVGDARDDLKVLDAAMAELAQIAGQKPKMTRARRAVANFKIRENMPIGCCVTLRGWRMYDFLDRLINVAIPRVRDFRGLPTNSFDGRGNYNMGVREQLIFTEIDYSKVSRVRGLDITAVTSANTDAECRELLTLFGMPFRRPAKN